MRKCEDDRHSLAILRMIVVEVFLWGYLLRGEAMYGKHAGYQLPVSNLLHMTERPIEADSLRINRRLLRTTRLNR